MLLQGLLGGPAKPAPRADGWTLFDRARAPLPYSHTVHGHPRTRCQWWTKRTAVTVIACLMAALMVVGASWKTRDPALHAAASSPPPPVCSRCRPGGMPSLDCPFVFYHVPKAAGSSLRQIVSQAVDKHKLPAFIPCYGGLPCEVGHERIDGLIACFERQPLTGFDESDMATCLRKKAKLDEWIPDTTKLDYGPTFPRGWAPPHANDSLHLARAVLRNLSCSSVVAAHVSPPTITRAALLFGHFAGSATAADLGLCRGMRVACQTCWTAVREPMARALTHVLYFDPDALKKKLSRDDVIRTFGGIVQSVYVTPSALDTCSVVVYEKMQATMRDLLASQPWLGATDLPHLNAHPVSDADRDMGIKALADLGLADLLQPDIALYRRVVETEAKV